MAGVVSSIVLSIARVEAEEWIGPDNDRPCWPSSGPALHSGGGDKPSEACSCVFTGAEARAQVCGKGKFEWGMLGAPDWRVGSLVRSVSRCLLGMNFLRVQRHTVDKT